MNLEELKLLQNNDAQDFMRKHLDDDPQKFALKYSSKKGLPIRAISEQIKNHKKAKAKFPSFQNYNLILESVGVEQSSGEIAAKFKTKLFSGKRLIDLTGGLGIDSIYFSKNFEEVFYCEQKEILCEIFKHNITELKINNITIHNGDSVQYLQAFPDNYFDLIYVDPARRDDSKRIISLQNSMPNILELQDLFQSKSKKFLLKASPALEIEEAIKQLKNISEIFVVSVDGECKEILFLIDSEIQNEIKISAVILNSKNDTELIFLKNHLQIYDKNIAVKIGRYFYEPDSAVIKSRLTDKIANEFNLNFINAKIDYLTSKNLAPDFPGRIFEVVDVQFYNEKKLKSYFKENTIIKTNIARRDFPLSPEKIKSIFKLKDGGENYFFFTKNFNNELIFIYCKKN